LRVTTEEEAKKERDKILAPYLFAKTKEDIIHHIGEAKKLVKANKTTIKDAWEIYLENSNRPDSGETTLSNYKERWDKFTTWLSIKHPEITLLTQVDAEVAGEYARSITNVSKHTVNNYVQPVRLLFKTLIGQQDTPFKEVKKLKEDDSNSHRELSEEELGKLLAVFDDPTFSIQDKDQLRTMFYLGAYTGLRISDCANMTWSAIKDGNIHWKPIKTKRRTKKAVTIHIHSTLEQELKKAEAWKTDEYVLPHIAKRYRKKSTACNVSKDAVRVFEQAGFKNEGKDGKR